MDLSGAAHAEAATALSSAPQPAEATMDTQKVNLGLTFQDGGVICPAPDCLRRGRRRAGNSLRASPPDAVAVRGIVNGLLTISVRDCHC